MKANMKRFVVAVSAAGCALVAAADNTKWKGADGAALNDAANWDGTAPFAGVSANGMLFAKGTPSDDYTVRLNGDLVCAGAWAYENTPYRVSYDLGGHTLTFLSAYSNWLHTGVTNVVQNGTIAFTNAAGTVQNVNVYGGSNGYSLFVERTGTFIGNLLFSDAGTKYLTVRGGGSYRGSLDARGAACQVTFTGDGTTVDINGGRFNVGGAGWGTRGLVADKAHVSNVAKLNVGGYDTYGVVGGASLVVSNATISQAGSDAATVGSGRVQATRVYVTHENELRLVDGASVDVKGNGFYVGLDGGSSSNCLYIAGEGTVLTNAGTADSPLIAGQGGDFNVISITDGARVYAGAIAAGGQRKSFSRGRVTTAVTSRWNRVTVEKSAVVAADSLWVGTRHADDVKAKTPLEGAVVVSNVFEFADGGQGVTKSIRVGLSPVSRDNRFVVRGAGTVVTLTSGVAVGFDGGAGNGLEVLDKGVLSGMVKLSVGYEYVGDADAVELASNNYVRVEGASVELAAAADTIHLGGIGNGGNRLWVGEKATLKSGGLYVRGWGQEVVVSNGTLNVDGSTGFRIVSETGETTSGGLRLSFVGATPRFVLGSGNHGPFTNACSFAFHVPAGGYAAAPLESTMKALRFSDDSVFSFDLSAAGSGRLRNMPLIRYSGTGEDRIVLSDALFAKIQAAAVAANPRAKVKLSADRRLLTLSLSEGALLIVR